MQKRVKAIKLIREIDCLESIMTWTTKLRGETPSSYTVLLLDDIQNFHQKNLAFTLRRSVTKACSILKAVADLNSSNISNLFGTSLDDKARISIAEQFVKDDDKTKLETKNDPIFESKAAANDDLMQPSFHKHVTLRRGMTTQKDDDLEEQESSGRKNFVGSQKHWVSLLWEPNSVDLIDRSTSSVSCSRHAHRQHSGIESDRIWSRDVHVATRAKPN